MCTVLKKYVSNAQTGWMRYNLGKTMTIYNISHILSVAFPMAFAPSNITIGFSVSGISPYKRDILTDADFVHLFVTNRPQEEDQVNPQNDPQEVVKLIQELQNDDHIGDRQKN